MGTIYLIRHGQASFGSHRYDCLSALGEQQARVLGEALRQRGLRPDRVLAGGMQRHHQTAAHCLAAMALPPSVQEDRRWDEFDHEAIVAALQPRYRDPAALQADLAQAENPRRAFQALFQQALQRWMSGTHDGDYAESWPAFRARVEQALLSLRESLSRSQTALVFSSGGPISAVVRQQLMLGDAATLRLNAVLANAALTKLIYSERDLYLSTVNEHSHFEAAPALLTYR
ncbi:Broad specificity phosphatase PhoE [Solimonas aquatica]|uniref:Broad specificity phosphatase PhoE n=1 Tax=Solimonas aquatica TaxID=489703 RepID=A0A1H9L8P5_9GAMM|nr:histidine phosphatase family protein [Solimonas aquatica]SER07688.1 Broad specificity phosphatase PhoE [Solimonas aquatica]